MLATWETMHIEVVRLHFLLGQFNIRGFKYVESKSCEQALLRVKHLSLVLLAEESPPVVVLLTKGAQFLTVLLDYPELVFD